MTKIVRVHQVGGPEVMQLEEILLPPPERGQVLVRNRAIGVNFIDIYHRNGHYPAAEIPFIPGDEAAGEIAAVGKGVKGFKEGDRVGYIATLGAYAEARIVDAGRLIKLPKSLSFETAAAILLKGLTAQYLLRQTFKVKEGHTVLIQAAAGATGQILCQWASALGAHVIGTAGTPEKAKLAQKAGAKHVILYRDFDFAEAVKEITKGALCDVVYDGVGKTTFLKGLDCLKPRGMFVSFGSASGPVEAFNLGLLAQKGSLFVTRPTLRTHIAKPEDLAKMAKDLFKAIEKGKICVPLRATAPLSDVVSVHKALEGRETTGATVLIP